MLVTKIAPDFKTAAVMPDNTIQDVSLSDYKADEKAPVRDYLLRRKYGSWNRVLSAAKHRFPVEVAPAPAPAPKKEAKVVEKED